MSHYTPEEKVKIARDPGRPGTADFISALFTDFFEQRGDRQCREDPSILGGVALYWEDDAWHMGRFVISPELRGRHVGTALLETALTDIFAQDIREVTMEARDTTVHILKKFGAETTGAPFSFYRGTVTPMRLTREAFWNSHTGGQT